MIIDKTKYQKIKDSKYYCVYLEKKESTNREVIIINKTSKTAIKCVMNPALMKLLFKTVDLSKNNEKVK